MCREIAITTRPAIPVEDVRARLNALQLGGTVEGSEHATRIDLETYRGTCLCGDTPADVVAKFVEWLTSRPEHPLLAVSPDAMFKDTILADGYMLVGGEALRLALDGNRPFYVQARVGAQSNVLDGLVKE